MIWKFSRFLKSKIGALDCSLHINCSIPKAESVGVKSITRLSVEINFAVSFAIELEERSDSLLSSSEVNSFVEPSVILYKTRD